jgi:hypothetical protein
LRLGLPLHGRLKKFTGAQTKSDRL